ncbi:MAG: citrate lyase subunit alpha, partial [Schleiferilactobacillus harbinensis]
HIPGVPVFTIQELAAKAEAIVGKPKAIEYTDRPVALVEYRDGSLIDVINQVKD